MSAKLSKTKPIQDEFSPEQPGQINVAGEVFFLNLPGDEQTDITSSLYDDSVKGDIAFQVLFLGGLPIEEGGTNFTKQEQDDVRRIFRAIFGPRQRILPTKSQLLSMGRKAIGKKGVVIPSKEPVFQLPCDDKDRDLMIKALEIRRTKLIEQIQNYDKLGISDIHGRYMRDHLKKLNDLLDNEINEARRTKKGCRYTGIIDPNASKPLALNEERMHRLLEIFAYLLAQGKDPLRALSGRYPIPSQVIPMMANPDAPDIYEYEEAFTKERDGLTPDYPQTLLKLKKVLEGDAALGRAVEGEELKNIIKDAESILFPTNPKRSEGTIAERKKRIVDHLRMKEDESKRSLAEIAGLTTRLTASEMELKKCTAAKEACEAKLAPLVSGEERKRLIEEKNKLGNQILDLKAQVAAAAEKGKAELEKLRGIQTLAVTNIRRELQEQRRIVGEKSDELKKCEGMPEQLKAAKEEAAEAKAELAALKAKPTGPSEEETAAKAVLEGKVASLTNDLVRLRGELAEKETELTSLRAAAASTGVPIDYAEKLTEIARLKGQISGFEEKSRGFERQIAGLNLDLAEKNNTIRESEETITELSESLAAAEAKLTTAGPSEADNLQREIMRLQADIAKKGNFIDDLVRNINTILTTTGSSTGIDSTDNEAAIQTKIKSLSTKFTTLQAAEASSAPRDMANQGTIICLLNAIFKLLRRMIIPKTPERKAEEPGWERLFQQVDTTARQISGRDTMFDDSIIRMFILLKKNYARLPTVEDGARRLQGLNERGGDGNITEAQYTEYYNKIEEFHRSVEPFTQEVRNYANVLLKQLLNTDDIEYSNYTFTNTGEIINTEGNEFQSNKIDMPSVFLYLLSLTQKTINKNQGPLIKLGCSVIPGAS
jgi:hypothetical protein